MDGEGAKMSGASWPIRVYYEDTDAAGIVYHANYLRFMERARTEWLRDLGFEQDALAHEDGVAFVVTRTDVRYLRPARFNEELVVTTTLERLRGASMELAQRIAVVSGETVCTARVDVACVDPRALKPRRIPRHVTRNLQGAN